MDEVTQQNSALVEENAATAKTLEQQSTTMTAEVNAFKIGDDDDVPLAPSAPKRPAAIANEIRRAGQGCYEVRGSVLGIRSLPLPRAGPPSARCRTRWRRPIKTRSGRISKWRRFAAARLGRSSAPEPALNSVREFAFSEADFRHLVQLAYEYAGISLSESKRNLLYSRLSRRLRILNLDTFSEYREILASDEREIENFINSISTNHTKFFREAHHFDHLRTHIAVPFVQNAAVSGNRRLRIWSAGCS